MSRIMRIVVGLALIGYGFYSGNAWFYLGVIPLATGLINWCPMEAMMGGCKSGECSSGSCSAPAKEDSTSCCASDDSKNSTSCCSTPKETVAVATTESKCCSSASNDGSIVIKILGTGCANCIALKKVVDNAVAELGSDIQVIKEEDINKIMEYKVMSMPGLVINEKVVSAGKLLTLEEVKELIQKEQK